MKNFIIILCVFMGSFTNAQTISTNTISTDTYQLTYPSKWSKANIEESIDGFFIYSPQEGKKDIFRENISLQIVDFKKGLTLEQYAKTDIEKLKLTMTNFNVIKSEAVTINNQVAYHIQYTGKMGFVDLIWSQYVFPYRNKLYTISCVSETEKQEVFAQTFDQIIRSFTLSDKENNSHKN